MNRLKSVHPPLAACAAGGVVLLAITLWWFCQVAAPDAAAPLAATVPEKPSLSGPPKLAPSTNTVACTPPPSPQRTRAPKPTGKGMLPDVVMRVLVEQAISDNDYKQLNLLMRKMDRIADPKIRLRLLEGLVWFEKTAVEDALAFLLDEDSAVSGLAAQVVTSRIAEIPQRAQREKLYAVALQSMPDTPDREILIATLEGESKGSCIRVLRDLAPIRETRPELWKKVAAVYESHFGRPYVSHIDALMHYNPRLDDRR